MRTTLYMLKNKRETSGHRSPKHSLRLNNKRYIWNNKMKIATRSTQQRYKRFYWQSTSLSPVAQMSHPCWNDRMIWVQKLDDVVWSDASWDVRNSPFVFRVRQGSHCGLFFYVVSYVVPQICHDIYATGVLEVARVGHKWYLKPDCQLF